MAGRGNRTPLRAAVRVGRARKALPAVLLGPDFAPLPATTNQPVQWDPADYARNSASQAVWAGELLSRLSLPRHARVLDVGCGDGQITAQIAASVPEGFVLGVDASPPMIAHAQAQHRASHLRFEVMDARQLAVQAASFDLVFSNAALHWVDDHRAFLRGAAAALRPGGRLAVSCGGRGNAQEVFVAVRAILRRATWRDYFRQLTRPYFFYAPEQYARWLPEAGFRAELIRLADKEAVHPGVAGLTAWLRTTWLPYTQRVPAERREEFLAAVTARYLARHPLDGKGQARVRMVRLEIEATRV